MNKLVVITGGTKGIGKALVELFAQKNFDIVTCSRSQKDLDQLAQEVTPKYPDIRISVYKADLSVRQEVDKFVDKIKSKRRPVDVLINNVGVFLPGEINKEPEGTLRKMIETNLYSAYDLTRGLIGDMMERREGYIFNICSTASITPYINGGSYCISKFALYGMSKVLREEMKSYNVKVTSVLPGATLTASWEGADIPPERFMKPDDVASAIWNAYDMSSQTVVEEIILRPRLGDI
jgi:short-subunit dehydrogenase